MEGLNNNYLLKELEEATKNIERVKKILSINGRIPNRKLLKLKNVLTTFTKTTDEITEYQYNKLKKEGKIKPLSNNEIDEIIDNIKKEFLK